MPHAILIIGEDPAQIDFDAPDVPEGMSAQKVTDGLNGSRDRLRAEGHVAEILLTISAETVERQVTEAFGARAYDIVVIGAGLRTLPPMLPQFERLIDVLRRKAPEARIGFNTNPADSDAAARRWI